MGEPNEGEKHPNIDNKPDIIVPGINMDVSYILDSAMADMDLVSMHPDLKEVVRDWVFLEPNRFVINDDRVFQALLYKHYMDFHYNERRPHHGNRLYALNVFDIQYFLASEHNASATLDFNRPDPCLIYTIPTPIRGSLKEKKFEVQTFEFVLNRETFNNPNKRIPFKYFFLESLSEDLFNQKINTILNDGFPLTHIKSLLDKDELKLSHYRYNVPLKIQHVIDSGNHGIYVYQDWFPPKSPLVGSDASPQNVKVLLNPFRIKPTPPQQKLDNTPPQQNTSSKSMKRYWTSYGGTDMVVLPHVEELAPILKVYTDCPTVQIWPVEFAKRGTVVQYQHKKNDHFLMFADFSTANTYTITVVFEFVKNAKPASDQQDSITTNSSNPENVLLNPPALKMIQPFHQRGEFFIDHHGKRYAAKDRPWSFNLDPTQPEIKISIVKNFFPKLQDKNFTCSFYDLVPEGDNVHLDLTELLKIEWDHPEHSIQPENIRHLVWLIDRRYPIAFWDNKKKKTHHLDQCRVDALHVFQNDAVNLPTQAAYRHQICVSIPLQAIVRTSPSGSNHIEWIPEWSIMIKKDEFNKIIHDSNKLNTWVLQWNSRLSDVYGDFSNMNKVTIEINNKPLFVK